MSDIEGVVKVGTLALRADGANVKSVAAALLEDAEYVPAEEAKAPATVEMTPELTAALRVIPHVFGGIQVDTIRTLSIAELERLGGEQDAIDQILKPLETRREAIKDAIKNHMDRRAEMLGLVTDETPRDAHGHVVIARKGEPEQIQIPGTGKVWSREFRAGKVEIDPDELLAMYERGEIDRKTYLSFTREVRVFDEAKAFAAMAKDPGLLKVFRKMIRRGRPSTALFVRKQK